VEDTLVFGPDVSYSFISSYANVIHSSSTSHISSFCVKVKKHSELPMVQIRNRFHYFMLDLIKTGTLNVLMATYSPSILMMQVLL
jgi:hypothetical protein